MDKPVFRQHRSPCLLLAALMAVCCSSAYAEPPNATQLPTGGQVVSGQGSIAQNGAAMTVNQGTPSMITNWQSFNIGKDASVNFVQPSSTAAVLNRVQSAEPSQIYGQISANGRVFLVNPSGVYFSPTAKIDVGGIAASALNMSNVDFNSGNYKFSGLGGAVVNEGEITAREGGFVALVGGNVDNAGVIRANAGQVAMAAGRDVSFDLTGNGLVSVKVDTAGDNARVNNTGKVIADGGRVWMTAKNAAPALSAAAVNQAGVVQANTLTMKNGEIWIEGDGGEVRLGGTTEARGVSSGERGGRVVATGGSVTVTSDARVDVSGRAGGGTINIGGGWQGKDPKISEAQHVKVARGAAVKADATGDGSGGTVVLWSGTATQHDGTLSARGAGSGRGGKVETSSRGELGVGGSVDAASPSGVGGEWLLDPNNVTISTAVTSNAGVADNYVAAADGANIQASAIEGAINLGTNVSVTTDGDIDINADISKTTMAPATITFAAANDITLATGADISSTAGALSLDFGTAPTTTGTITLNGTLASGGGTVNFYKPTVLGHATPVSTTRGSELDTNLTSGNITFHKDVSLAAPGYAVALSATGVKSGGNYVGNGGDILFKGSIASDTPSAPPIKWSQALTLDTSGVAPGSITLGTTAADSVGGSAANTQLKSLTLTGPTNVTLNSGTINLMDVSGNVMVASSNLGTPTIKLDAANTTINVTGGTRAGISGYADYKQENFDISTTNATARTLTINADRSIKIKDRTIDGTAGGGTLAVTLNPFVAAGAVGGGIYLDNASVKSNGGAINFGSSLAYATGFGSDENGKTDGVYLLNTKLLSSNGAISVYGKAPLTSAEGSGVRLSGASTDLNSGTGNLIIDGRVTAATNAGNKDGLVIGEGGSSRVTLQASGAGTITLTGDASAVGVNPTGGSRYDGTIISSKALIMTATGDITITGKGGGGDQSFISENHGIRIEDTNTAITSTSGNISLNGTSGGKTTFTTGENSFGIYAKGQTMYLGSADYTAINAGVSTSGISATGIITLTADSMEFVNSSSLRMKVASGGELRILPETAGRDIQFHGDPSSPDLNADSSVVGKLYLGSNWFNGGSLSIFQPGFGSTGYGTAGSGATGAITIGRTDGSGTMTVADATTLRDNTTLWLGSTPGNIKVNQPLTVEGASAAARILTMETFAGGAGAGAITANQLLLLGTGSYIFSGNNLLGTVAAELTGTTTGHLTINNAQAMTIGSVSSERFNTVRSAVGITANANTTSNEVTVGTTSGTLTISQSVDTGNKGVASLYATHATTGGVVETGTAIVTAGKMYVGSGGVLSWLGNDNLIKQAVTDGVLAASATNGLEFKNAAAAGNIQIGRVSYSARSADASGAVTTATANKDGIASSGAVALWLPSGDLTQDTTVNGLVTQGDVQATTLSLAIDTGLVTLDNATNQIGTLAAVLGGAGKVISVFDSDGLVVGNIASTVTGGSTTVSGITTNLGDVILKASANGTSTTGDLEIANSIDTTSGGAIGTGVVARLASGKGAVNETGTAIVKAKSLLVEAATTSSLDNLNEVFDGVTGNGIFAANVSGAGQGLKFKSVRSLDLGTVSVSHAVGPISGITATTGDVTVTLVNAGTTNDLTQTQLVKAGGLKTDVDTGKVLLDLITGGNTNEIGTLSAVLGGAGKDFTLNEKDGVTVGTVNGTSGVTTASGGKIAVATQGGSITVTRDVSAGGAGVVDLRANGVAADIAINPATGQTATIGSTGGGTVQLYAGKSMTTATANGVGTEISTTGQVLFQAGSGVGSDSNRIEMAGVTKIAGTAGDSIFLRKLGTASDLEIGTVNALNFNGIGTFVAGPTDKSGLSTTANNGSVTLTTQGGDLSVTQGITAHGSGYVDIRTANAGNLGDIALTGGATVASTSGTIQMLAGNTITTDSASGTTAELSTTGSVLLEAGLSIGTDGNRIELVNASKLAARTLSNGASSDLWLREWGTATDLEVGVVTVQNSASTLDNAVTASGQTTVLAGKATELKGLSTTANNGKITLSTQGGDLTISQNVTAHGSGYVDIRTANAGNLGDIAISNGTTVGSTSGTVQMVAGNTITTDSASGTTTEIATTGNVVLEAGLRVGSDSNRIELGSVSKLAARTLGNGANSDLWLRELGTTADLEIGTVTVQNSASTLDNAVTASGQTTVLAGKATELKGLSTTANDGKITLSTQGGDLTITQNVTAHGSGYIDVRTANAGNLGDLFINGGATVSSTSGTVQIIAGNTITTDSANGTTTEVVTTGSVLLEAGLSLGTDTNRIEFGNVSKLAARTLSNGANSDLWLRELGTTTNLEVGAVTVQNSASTLDNAVTASGQTTVVAGKATELQGLSTLANNGKITLSTQGGDLTITQNVTAHGSGYVDIRAANTGNLGDIAITSGATVASTSGTVQMIAGNTITTDSASGTTTEVVTTGSVLLEAGLSLGTDTNRIELGSVSKLSARTLSNGANSDLWLRALGTTTDLEVGIVTVQNSASTLDNAVSAVGQTTVVGGKATELKGLSTLANNGKITLSTQGGDLTITQNVTAHGSGYVDIRTANAGNLGDIAITSGATVASTSGTVQMIAGNTITTDSASGAIAEISTTESVLLEAGLRVGTDGNRIELVNVKKLAARTLSNGVSSDLWLREMGTTTDLEIGTVTVQNSANTLDNAVAALGQTTVVAGKATELKGLSTLANNGKITLSTQGGDLTITQNITAHGGGYVDIRTANTGNLGDVAINNGATVGSTSGAVQMVVGNTITTDSANGTTTDIATTGSVLLEAGLGVGSDTNRIELGNVGTLAARTLGNGADSDLWLRKLGTTSDLGVGAVTVQNSASTLDNAVLASGQTTVAGGKATELKGLSTTANNGKITLTTQGGDLTITQNVTAHGSGYVDLRTANVGNLGDVLINSGATISSTSGAVQIIAGNTLATDSANGTTSEVVTTGDVLLEAGLSVGSDNNRIELGNVSSLAARTLTNGLSSDLWLRKLGTASDLLIGTVAVQNSASTLDNAVLATGQATVVGGKATELKGLSTTANNGKITLTTQGGDLTVTQNITAEGSGYVDIRTANVGNLGDIFINSGATITSTSGTVQMVAGNSITTDSLNGTTTEIDTTGSVLLEAGLNIGSDNNRVELSNASQLAARTLTNGVNSDLWLRKLGGTSDLGVGAVAVQNSASTLDNAVVATGPTAVVGGKATELHGLSTLANNSKITLSTQGGDLTITRNVTADGSGYVDIRTANAGNLGDVFINSGATISSTSGTVQVMAGNTITTDSASGTTTEIATTGEVLLEAGLSVGSDSNRIELGSVSKLAARTLASGIDSDLWLRKLGSGSDLEVGTVTVQNSANTLDNAVSATGQTTVVGGKATELQGLSTTANNGKITVTTQGGDLTVAQNITAHGSGYVDIRTANVGNLGDIFINNGATISSTSGTVQMVAGNTITTDSASGTTTEVATTGSVLIEAGLSIGSDNNRIELGDVSTLAARTLTNGADSDLWLRKLGSASDLSIGTVTVQNSASTLDNAVAASGQATVVNSKATTLKGLSTVANNGKITLSTQGGDLTIAQNITADGSGYVDLRTANAGNLGDIFINGGATVSSTSATVQMVAGNTITTDSGSGTTTEVVTTGNVLLEAGLSIGSDSNRIELGNVGNLAARTRSNGANSDLWLRKLGATSDLELGVVTVQNSASILDNAVLAAGQTTVVGGKATELHGLSTLANNGKITLSTQGGDLTITQNITAHGSGYVDLRTANTGNLGDFLINGGATVSSTSGTVQIIAGNTITTDSANGTITEISTTGDVLLEAGLSLGGDSKRIELGNVGKLAARTLGNGANSDLWLRKLGTTGDLSVGTVTVQNSASTLDNAVLATGQATVVGGKATELKGLSTTANNGKIALTTQGGDLTVTQNITADGSGYVDIRTANAGNLGDIFINSGATISSTSGSVQMIAGNTITTDSSNGTTTEIATTGSTLLEAGLRIGSDSNRIELGNVSKLAARTLSNGVDSDLWLRKLGSVSNLEVGAVTVQNSASILDNAVTATGQTAVTGGKATALHGLSTMAGNGKITFSSQGGDVTITQNVTAHGSGYVDFRTANAGNLGDIFINNGATVSSTSGPVQMIAGNTITTDSSNGTTTEIMTTGSTLLEAGLSVGSDSNRIELGNVSKLAVRTLGNGQASDMWLRKLGSASDLEIGVVTVQNGVSTLDNVVATIGQTTVTGGIATALKGLSTTANNGKITLSTQGGDLTLTQNITAHGGGYIDVRTANAGSLGDFLINGGATVSSTSGTVQIIAGNTITTDSANGTITEISTTGDVLLEAGLSVGSDNNRIELADVSTLAARTLGNGVGSDLWLRKLGTTGDIKIGTVAVQNSASTLDNAIVAAGQTTVAAGKATELKGLSTTANDGKITFSSQGGDVTITQGVTAHGSGYVDLRTANAGNLGDIFINGGATVGSTSGTVQVIAGNTITTDSGSGTTTEVVTTGGVLLEAGLSVGSDSNRIELGNVSRLSARTLGNGAGSDLWLRKLGSSSNLEVGTVTVQNSASTLDNAVVALGQTVVSGGKATALQGLSTMANNGKITLSTQGGDVTITQGVTAHGSGYVDLRTANAGNLGDFFINGGATVSSTSGTVQMIAGNTITTDSASGTTTEIMTTGNVLLEAGLSVGSDSNRIELGNVSKLSARTLGNGAGSDLWLRKLGSTSDLEVGTITIQNSASTLDNAVVATGQTAVAGGKATELKGLSTTANDGKITFSSQGGDVTITQNVTAHGGGYVDLRTANAGNLGDIFINGGATVSSTSGTVQMIAGNTITTDSNNGTTTEIMTTGSALLEAGLSIGSDSNRIELGNASKLSARVLGNGASSDLWLRKLGATSDLSIGTVTVQNSANLLDNAVAAVGQTTVVGGKATELQGLSTAANNGKITLSTQGGDLTITQNITAHGSGYVDLRTARSGNLGDFFINGGATVSSTNGTVQIIAGNTITTDSASGTTTEIMTTGSVLLEAGLRIGSDNNRVELGSVGKLTARTLGSGTDSDLWLRKLGSTSDLEVGTITIQNSASLLDNAVAATGQTTVVGGQATELKGLSTLANNGKITLSTQGGDVTITQNITAHGSGYVDLRTANAGNLGDFFINGGATVSSTSGTVQMVAGNTITTDSASGTTTEIMTTGSVLLEAGLRVGSDSNRIELGNVSQLAARTLANGDDSDLWLRKLGTTSDLSIGAVAIQNSASTLDNAVATLGQTTLVSGKATALLGLSTTDNSGKISLSTQGGDLTIAQGVTANGYGYVDIRTANVGNLGDIFINNGATVSSTSGTVQMIAGNTITTDSSSGTSTEVATRGSVLLEAGLSIGSDTNRIELGSVSNLAARTLANGINSDLWLRKLGSTSDLELGVVTVQNSANLLDNAVSAMGQAAVVGGVVTELQGLSTTANNGKITLSTQGGDLTITRNITAHGGGYVDLRTANAGNLGDIFINNGTTVSSTGGTVQMVAGNTITTDSANGTTTEIVTSGNVLLEAGLNIGSDSNRIELGGVSQLAARTLGNGVGSDLWLRKLGTASDLEVGAVTVQNSANLLDNAVAAVGQTAVVGEKATELQGFSTTANDGKITLSTQGGDVTITRNITAHGGGYVDIRTANVGNLGDIFINRGATVSSTSGTVQMMAGNTITTDSANGTTTEIVTNGNVLLEAGLNIGTDNNRIELGNVSKLAARTLANGANSDLWLRKLGATSDLEIGTVTIQNSASLLDNAILAAGQATVVGDVATELKGLSTTANDGKVTLTTAGGDVTITQGVTAHGGGYVDLRTANAGNLGDIFINGGATVSSTSGTVQMVAGNTITTDSASGTTTEISTTGNVLLEAGLSVGSDNNRIELGNVSKLAARTLANGANSDLWLRKLGKLSNLEVGTVTVLNSTSVLDNAVVATGQAEVTGGRATGLQGLSTTANDGKITLTTQGGYLAITQNVTAAGSGYVDLRTAGVGNFGNIAINNGATVGSTSGTVQMIAGNTITTDSSNGTTTEIMTTGSTLLEAGLSVGSDSNRIELGNVSRLAARTLGNGQASDVWLRKLGSGSDLEIGAVTIQNSANVLDNAVMALGQTTITGGVATELRGLSTTANNGKITLSTQGGDLTITQNITAHGGGYVDVRTTNAGNLGDVFINGGATVSSTSGTVQVIAGNAITTDSGSGTTTEIMTTGDVLLEAGLGVGSDNNRIEFANVGTLAARTLGNGVGSDLWLRKLGTTGDIKIGTVAVQNSTSTLDNVVVATGQTTIAAGKATELKGLSTTANDGKITFSSQGGDVTITQGVTAHGSGSVDIRTANAGNLGDVFINGGATVSSTSGTVQMIAGNTITTDSNNGVTTEIVTTGSVLLEAGLSVGSDSNRIELGNVSRLSARTLNNGVGSDLWLRKLGSGSDIEVGAITVQNSASTLDNAVLALGQTVVSGGKATALQGLSTLANNGKVTLTTQGGDLTITQGVTAHGGGYVDLRTANAGNLGDIFINGGATVGSTSGTVQMIAGNTITTDSNNGVTTEIMTTGNVLLEAGLSVGSDSNRIELGNASRLSARTLGNGAASDLWLRKLGSTSDLEIGRVAIQNGASTLDNAVVATGQTAVVGDKAAELWGLSTTANDGKITFSSQGGDVTITQNITAHGGGYVDIRTANAGNLGDIFINGGAMVSSTSGTVQMIAGNTITTDSNSGVTTEIMTTGNILLEAGLSVGTDGNRMELGNASKLAARTLANGANSDLWLRKLGTTSDLEIGAVTVQNSASLVDNAVSAMGQTVVTGGKAVGLAGLSTTANDGKITFSSQGGDVTITRNVTAHGGGYVDIRTASTGNLGDIFINNGATVSSTSGVVQMIAGNTIATDSGNGTATEIATTGSVLLEAGSRVGTDSHRIELGNVSRLAARTLKNGSDSDLWLRKLGATSDLEIGAVTVQNSGSVLDNAVVALGQTVQSGGKVTELRGLSTTSNNGNITLSTQGGDVTITQGVTAHSGGYVDLRTANAGNLGDIFINNGATVSSTSGTVQMVSGNTITTDSTNGTTTEISTTGHVLLEAGLGVGSDSNRIELGNVSKLAARTLGNGPDSDLWLRKLGSTSDLEVGIVTVQNSANLLDNAVAATGQTTVVGGQATELKGLSTLANNGKITLSTQGGDVTVTQNITAADSGYLDIRTARAGNLGDVTINNGATLSSTRGTVQIVLGNSLSTNSLTGVATEIATAGDVLLFVDGAVGSDVHRIETSFVNNLATESVGGQWLRHSGSNLKFGTVLAQNGASALDHAVVTKSGVKTSDAPVVLTVASGNLTVNQKIDAGSGDIGLKASGSHYLGADITGNIVTMLAGNGLGNSIIQETAGRLDAVSVRVVAGDTISLDRPGNVIGTIAGSSGSAFTVADSVGLVIGRVDTTKGSDQAGTSLGLTANASDITIRSEGKVSQTSGAVVSTARERGLSVTSSGPVVLDESGNSIGVLATSLTAQNLGLSFANFGDFAVGTVSGVTGITTKSGPVTLKSQWGGITETGSAAIVADTLGVVAGKGAKMINPNHTNILAATTGDDFSFFNTGDLTIDSVSGTDGIDSGGKVWVRTAGDMTLFKPVIGRGVDDHVAGGVNRSSVVRNALRTGVGVGEGIGHKAVVLASEKTFRNLAGPNGVQAPNGRWEIYDDNPKFEDRLGGLDVTFRRLNTWYNDYLPSDIGEYGNGYITTTPNPDLEKYAWQGGGADSAVTPGSGNTAMMPAVGGGGGLDAAARGSLVQVGNVLPVSTLPFGYEGSKTPLWDGLPLVLAVNSSARFVADLSALVPAGDIVAIGTRNGEPLPEWLHVDTVAMRVSGTVPSGSDTVGLRLQVKVPGEDKVQTIDVFVTPSSSVSRGSEVKPSGSV